MPAENFSFLSSRSTRPLSSLSGAPVPRAAWWIAIIFFTGYLAYVAWYVSPHAAGADAAGYLNSAKFLMQGRLTGPVHFPAWAEGKFPPDYFAPLSLGLDAKRQFLVPGYPVGQPLQLAFFGKLFGLNLGPTVMNVLATLSILLLLRATALRLGVRPRWALAMVAVFALSPLVFSYTLQVMSELTSTLWVLAAMYGALCSRERPRWALLAGFALAMAVLVRPANLIAALPVLIAIGFSFRPLVLCGLAGLPGAVFLGWYNHRLYGSPFVTGYGSTVGALFGATYFAPTVWHYLKWLPVQLTPLVLAALGLPFIRLPSVTRRVVGGWAGAFLLFYAVYYCTKETWWTLRFLLPALPALAIAATLVLQEKDRAWFTVAFAGSRPSLGPDAWRRITVSVVAGLLPLALGWQLAWNRHFKSQELEVADRVYDTMSAWVNKNLPPQAIFTCGVLSGAFYYYSEKPCFYYENFDADSYATFIQLAAANGADVYAGIMDHEEERAFQLMPGKWVRVATIRYGTSLETVFGAVRRDSFSVRPDQPTWRREATREPSAGPLRKSTRV